MTIEKFRHLVNNGYRDGKIITATHETPPFALNEVLNEIVEFEGFQICYQDQHFLWMKDANGKAVKEEDCTFFNVEEFDNYQLALLIKDAQRVMKEREVEAAKQAIEQFENAWKRLKEFGEVRMRVDATGEKHFHTTVDRLKLEFLPFT